MERRRGQGWGRWEGGRLIHLTVWATAPKTLREPGGVKGSRGHTGPLSSVTSPVGFQVTFRALQWAFCCLSRPVRLLPPSPRVPACQPLCCDMQDTPAQAFAFLPAQDALPPDAPIIFRCHMFREVSLTPLLKLFYSTPPCWISVIELITTC